MAEKILKSLKFPGLEDTYVIPEINTAGSNSLPVYSENGELKAINSLLFADYDEENEITYDRIAIDESGITLDNDSSGGSTSITKDGITSYGGIGHVSLNGDGIYMDCGSNLQTTIEHGVVKVNSWDYDGPSLAMNADFDGNTITGLTKTPTDNYDAVNKQYVDNKTTDVIYSGDDEVSGSISVNADTLGGKLPSEFAPAGYGYGDELTFYSIDGLEGNISLDVLETYIQDEKNWGKVLRFSMYYDGGRQGYVDLAVQSSSNAFVSYYLFGYGVGVVLAKRQKFFNEWFPLEWVNPPMVAGVEYRTTERYNGKPVYTKCLELGALTSSTLTHFSLDVYTADNPTFVDFKLYITDGTFTYDLLSNAFGGTSAYLWNNGNKYYINLVPHGDMTGWTGRAIVKWIYG